MGSYVRRVAATLLNEPDARKRRTFQIELRRAASYGILETAGATFLLLIAVKYFQTGATAKALLMVASPLGLLISPLAVSFTRWMQWTAAKGAAVTSWLGCVGFGVAAVVGGQTAFIASGMLGVLSISLGVPMLTQIYHENYPANERGDLFSKTVMVRVLVSATFAWLAGMWLESHLGHYRWLMAGFAVASGFGAWWIGGCPSGLLTGGSTNPFHGIRHIRDDRLFRHLLTSWMLLGSGNLLMLPLRVEYLANPRFGISASPAVIALVVSTLPSLTNLVFARFWGRLFDSMNFFVLRIILNTLFIAGIATFFLIGGMSGFIAGGFFFGMANSGGNLAWSLWVTKVAPSGLVAEYMGVHSFLTGVRGVITPFFAFYMIEFTPMSTLAWIGMISIFLGSVILGPEANTLRKRRAGQPVVPKPGGLD